MPHGSIWFPEPEYDREKIITFMDKLAGIAEGMGYTTHGGPKSGRGNVRRLLEAIVWNEVELCKTSEIAPQASKEAPGM